MSLLKGRRLFLHPALSPKLIKVIFGILIIHNDLYLLRILPERLSRPFLMLAKAGWKLNKFTGISEQETLMLIGSSFFSAGVFVFLFNCFALFLAWKRGGDWNVYLKLWMFFQTFSLFSIIFPLGVSSLLTIGLLIITLLVLVNFSAVTKIEG